ncbi:sugar nucleotide-binding protein [Streptomyces synnematoformans]|uniref:Sugar nucleotide-binding protein n=1 Tax=Streptomyces synnematoformans TaxID=415721 RepID=A0ABP5KJG3_9ACTN
MTMLIVGASGFLGRELARQALAAGHTVTGTFTTNLGTAEIQWLPLDLRNHDEIDVVLDKVQPRLVINAAARKADWVTTAEGAGRLAMAAARREARLVHVSSDAVFSGTQVTYDECATPDPITAYGAAKAAAETAIRLVNPAALVIRTSLIVGYGYSRHEKFVHDVAAGRAAGPLFTDDIRCPVHVSDLAAAILELAPSEQSGIRHVAGQDAVSRHELGLLIARRDGLNATAIPAGRRAGTGVPGALDVRLDSGTALRTLRIRVRGAREFLSTAAAAGASATWRPSGTGGGPGLWTPPPSAA